MTDKDLEANVLGGYINDKNYRYEIEKYLSEDCFTDTVHRAIYRKASELHNKAEEFNCMTLANSIEGVELFDVMNISTKCIIPEVANAALLYDLKVKRDLFMLGNQIANASRDKTKDPFEILKLIENSTVGLYTVGGNEAITMLQACEKLNEIVEKNQASSKELTGASFGLSEIDRVTGGIQKGNLIVVGAESQMGKTALGLNIAQSAAEGGDTVGIFSLEMSAALVASRMVSRSSGVSGFRILRKPLVDEELVKYDKGVGKVVNLPIYIDDSFCDNANDICNQVRGWVKKHGVKGFVVDYLQLMQTEGRTEEAGIAQVARKFKNLCTELDIWCILISQLNRNTEFPVPTLNRMRGSGQIEDAADVVLLLYRPEKYPTLGLKFPEPYHTMPTENRAWIHVAKNRNGEQTDFVCEWNGATTTFSDLDESILIENNRRVEQLTDDCPF